MSDLLLELYIEEIPANMQKSAEEGYKAIFTKAFENISIKYDNLEVFIGPRRIVLSVEGLPDELDAQEIEMKGPKTSAPEKAIEGFCKSNKINKTDLIEQDGYYFHEKKIAAKPVIKVLPEMISESIGKYVWPKSMYWGRYKIKFVRPLLNILCIFDGKILTLEYGHLKANNITYGHRFASYKPIQVSSFKDYKEKLSKAYVVLDRKERLDLIQRGIKELEKKHNIKVFDEPRLLEEVAGLNEHINVFAGKIDKKFMHLPPEALVSSMKTHQKYFPCRDGKGNFAPYFIFVSNAAISDKAEIISGNEKVLSARLADALYFYEQDQKTKLKDRDFSKIIFHANIGTMKDKTERLVSLAEYFDKGNKDLAKAAMICKSDLTTEMVREFPELQGIMGHYYAKLEGYSEDIAHAIRDHYKPMGGDDIPAGMAAKLALIDKIDSLVSLMIAGERATGSKDPFALRRMALDIIKIILDQKMNIKLGEVISFVFSIVRSIPDCDGEEVIQFIQDRLKNHYKEEYGSDLVKAGIDLSKEDNLLIIDAKMKALKAFAHSDAAQELLIIYKRANNILEDKNYAEPEAFLFCLGEEKALYNSILGAIPKVKKHMESNQFESALRELLELKNPLTSFFDNVIVNDENPQIAQNRKAMLKMLSDLFKQIAHFDYL